MYRVSVRYRFAHGPDSFGGAHVSYNLNVTSASVGTAPPSLAGVQCLQFLRATCGLGVLTTPVMNPVFSDHLERYCSPSIVATASHCTHPHDTMAQNR